LEEKLYKNYLPLNYKSDDVITYQWHQNRDYNLRGHFNFYYSISKNSISRASMSLYILLLLAVGIAGDLLAGLIKDLFGMIG
jgi:hypothetical protein